MWSLNWHLLSVNAACSWLEKLRLLQLHRTNGLITSIHDPAIIWVVFQRLHLKIFCPSLIEGRIRPFHISSCLNKHKEAKNIFFLVFEKPSQLRKPTQLCVKKREKSHVDIWACLQRHAVPIWMPHCAVICLFVVCLFTCSISANLPQSRPLMSSFCAFRTAADREACGMSSAWKAHGGSLFIRYWSYHAQQGQSQKNCYRSLSGKSLVCRLVAANWSHVPQWIHFHPRSNTYNDIL